MNPKSVRRIVFGCCALFFSPAHALLAADFSNLHNFADDLSEGSAPQTALVRVGDQLFGTTSQDGSNSVGTIFRVNVNGTGFTNLFQCDTNSAYPTSLIVAGNILCGTVSAGGTNGSGAVFKLNLDGTGFTNVYQFTATSANDLYETTNRDGTGPFGLFLSGGVLYGTTMSGSFYSSGNIFRVNLDGTSFTNLYNFSSDTNVDNGPPSDGLILAGNTFYGVTSAGGSNQMGTIFKVNVDGTGFTNLYQFHGIDGEDTNGETPSTALVLSGETLYGTAKGGGTVSQDQCADGTVFAISTNGMGFTTLHNFVGDDGAAPDAAMILSGNMLYGTTLDGGTNFTGNIFAIKTNGAGFTNLYNFSIAVSATNSDGTGPQAALFLSGNVLYGTAAGGGTGGNGTIFALALPLPVLNIQPLPNAVVLSWDNPAFSLQTAGTVDGIYTNLSAATSPFTNGISAVQQFFRLYDSP